MRRSLSQECVVAQLDDWVGHQVSVRVVSGGGELLAVFQGNLHERSEGEHPGHFWHLAGPSEGKYERLGIYLHPELFEHAAMREGEFVLELRQAGITFNVRSL
jgi:hypothetical protein